MKSSGGFCESKVVYRLPTGQLGFDFDDLGARMLEWLLLDAKGWDNSSKKVVVCGSDITEFILTVRQRRLVTFHGNSNKNEETIKTSSLVFGCRHSVITAEQKKQHIERVIDKFKMICIWDIDMNPTVFSVNENIVEDIMQNLSTAFGIEVYKVDVDGMPHW